MIQGHKANASKIALEVQKKHGVSVSDMKRPDRRPHILAARDEAISRIRRELKWSYPRIGGFFKKHHTTVIAAIRRQGGGCSESQVSRKKSRL